MRKTTVSFNGEPFSLELDEDDLVYVTPSTQGLLFRVVDGNSNVVGCLSCSVFLRSSAIWKRNWNRRAIDTEFLKDLFCLVLPSIDYPVGKEELFGEYAKSWSCLKILIDAQDDGYDPQHKIFYLRGGENPDEFIQRRVYAGQLTDAKIQQRILKLLFEHWQESFNTNRLITDIQNETFLDERFVLRNLDYLKNKGLIKAIQTDQAWVSAGITADGVDYVNNNYQFTSGGQVIMANQIIGQQNNVQTSGNNSPAVVGSESVSINITQNQIEELEQEIQKHFSEETKAELLKKVEEVKKLSSDKSNHPKIRAILGGLLTKTSEVATVAGLIVQLLQGFN